MQLTFSTIHIKNYGYINTHFIKCTIQKYLKEIIICSVLKPVVSFKFPMTRTQTHSHSHSPTQHTKSNKLCRFLMMVNWKSVSDRQKTANKQYQANYFYNYTNCSIILRLDFNFTKYFLESFITLLVFDPWKWNVFMEWYKIHGD